MRITSKQFGALLAYATAASCALLCIVPLAWVASSSLKSDDEIYTVHGQFLPLHPTLSHYLGLVSALPHPVQRNHRVAPHACMSMPPYQGDIAGSQGGGEGEHRPLGRGSRARAQPDQSHGAGPSPVGGYYR